MNGREEERMAKKLNVLESIWGLGAILDEKDGVDSASRYHLLRELDLDGRHYALLRKKDESDPDAYVFRVISDGDSHRMVHVEDEYEWEEVADAIDEMLYFGE